MQTKSFPLAALVALSSVFLAACTAKAPAEEPIRAVKTMTVGLGGMQASQEFSGEVRARIESRLSFRVAGKIVQRPVELGQRVKAGQMLMQLDAQDYRLSVEGAKAQWNAAVTNRDLAAADLKRFKELREQNFISGAELERREAALKAAQAQVDQAQAQVNGQTNQVAYTALLADAAGVVTALEAEAGQVVAAGSPVVRIARDGPRDIVFAVAEDKVGAVRVGSTAEVRAWGTAAPIKAVVREVAASADPVTRTFTIKASLPSGDAMALGTTVSVRPQAFEHSAMQVIKLPTSAIRQEAGKAAVWLLDEASMTVKSQAVEVATADGNEVVIGAGLTTGMQVVVAGVHVLSPGQKVSKFVPRDLSAGAGNNPAGPTGGKPSTAQ